MTNLEILQISLDGFKDGFDAATRGLVARMSEDNKENFLHEMEEIKNIEIEKHKEIWYTAFKEVAKL